MVTDRQGTIRKDKTHVGVPPQKRKNTIIPLHNTTEPSMLEKKGLKTDPLRTAERTKGKKKKGQEEIQERERHHQQRSSGKLNRL